MATRIAALKPSDLARVVVDTTVQPAMVTRSFSTGPASGWRGWPTHSAWSCVNPIGASASGSEASIGVDCHAHRFKRADSILRKLKTHLVG